MDFDWQTEYGEIVAFLLDWLEDEHTGTKETAWEVVKGKWNIKSEHGEMP